MGTPLEYEARYKTLKVDFATAGSAPVTLTINQYRLGKAKPEAEKLAEHAHDYFAEQHKKASTFTLDLIVNGQPATFKTWHEVQPHVHAPFSGKGSPEDCQIAAQMAVLVKRTTVDNLQTYCDNNMGLDCNGFVGNYLWHERGGAEWRKLAGEHDLGPNMSIDGFFDKGRPIGSLDQIQAGDLNVFGLVSSTTMRIVPVAVWNADGTLNSAGHIVISEPGRISKSVGLAKSASWVKLHGVEATGHTKAGVAVGLTDNTCTITEYIDPHTHKPKSPIPYMHCRIFNIHRDSKNQDDLFAICAFSVTTT